MQIFGSLLIPPQASGLSTLHYSALSRQIIALEIIIIIEIIEKNSRTIKDGRYMNKSEVYVLIDLERCIENH